MSLQLCPHKVDHYHTSIFFAYSATTGCLKAQHVYASGQSGHCMKEQYQKWKTTKEGIIKAF
jgi:hypothetical protein